MRTIRDLIRKTWSEIFRLRLPKHQQEQLDNDCRARGGHTDGAGGCGFGGNGFTGIRGSRRLALALLIGRRRA